MQLPLFPPFPHFSGEIQLQDSGLNSHHQIYSVFPKNMGISGLCFFSCVPLTKKTDFSTFPPHTGGLVEIFF